MRIDNNSLIEAIKRAERGLIDAELGGNLIKLRIAKKNQGKSSGYRTLIAYRKNEKVFFLYGFAKNERENVDVDELESFKKIGAVWLKTSKQDLERSLSEGRLQEVHYE